LESNSSLFADISDLKENSSKSDSLFSDSSRTSAKRVRYCLLRRSLMLNDQAVSSTSARLLLLRLSFVENESCEFRLSRVYVTRTAIEESLLREMRILIRYLTKANKDSPSIR